MMHARAGRGSVSRRLRIAIATTGRFHVLDLARELDALGHEVRFYSWVPRRRALSFGLPPTCHVDLLPWLAPIAVWQRYAKYFTPGLREALLTRSIDALVSTKLEPCDVFIGMSGIYLSAARAARRRFGARIVVERGSQHVLAQAELLQNRPGAGPTTETIRRELESYRLADRISVPSRGVALSFDRDAYAASKLIVNPYGVDLNMFPLLEHPARNPPRALYVGAWTFQKGADLLTAAILDIPDLQLLHVGSPGDVAFPNHPRFQHIDAVPQEALSKFYGRADFFVLPSRQDGYGLVLNQAIASGLPVLCSENTGGVDLAARFPGLVSVCPAGAAEPLKQGLVEMLSRRGGIPRISARQRESLSWASYGRRYERSLLDLLVTEQSSAG